MELLFSDKYFVLQHKNESLWVNRENGAFSTKSGRECVENNSTLSLIGKVYGFVGVLRLSAAAEPRLIFIRSQETVCRIKDHDIYKITSVVSVPVESECEIDVESHPLKVKQESVQINPAVVPSIPPGCSQGSQVVTDATTSITWNKVKIPPCPNARRYGGRSDKTERRLLDEFHKMFLEADSFYYSHGYDIFNTVQRQTTANTSIGTDESKKADFLGSDVKKDKNQNEKLVESVERNEYIWKKADERFLWNQYMLSDLITSKDESIHKWAIAIMQGSIQHRECHLDPSSARVTQNDSEAPANLDLILISRRSKYRAGTRYLKRGIDEQGKVANYVETEQIMIFRGHIISFVLTRGSVPVFWSQPGYKYRPPIRLDKSIEESLSVFEKHIDEELKIYGKLTLINLVEKNGRERVLEDAFRKSVLKYNSEDLTYVAFDFHDKCRGLKFDNIRLLTDGVAEIIKNMAYCWVDSFGVVMQQSGTFRVNCVDCLDRTNVVQSFLAREVLSHQLSKVGLLMPEIGLSESIKMKFLDVWANNGDIISKQYAGTNALKGDFTRTGERRIAGVMKDGMNSANRYLNNRLKDGTRQACIDLVLGVRSSVSEEELTLGKEAVEEKESTTELVSQMIEDVKLCLIPPHMDVIGSWGLVNAKTNDVGAVDVDSVLVLTDSDCFVALYDSSFDTIASSTKISLNSVTALEFISETVSQQNVSSVWGLFQASGNSNSQACVPSLKLHFMAEDETRDFFHFRSSNIQFFNNTLTQIVHPDEMMEALKMLAETIKVAAFSHGNKIIPITQGVSPSRSNQRGGINSWIPRWNTPAPPPSQQYPTESLSRKFSPASMQRFAPSFLKRKRNNNNVQAADDEEPTSKVDSHNLESAFPGETCVPQSLKIPSASINAPSNLLIEIQHHARTPMETRVAAHDQWADLFLPSCGIISFPERKVGGMPVCLIPAEYLNEDNKVSPGISPVTPVMDVASQDITPTSSDTNASMRLPIPQDLLQRHRFSLPTNTLSIAVGSPCKTTGRSTTPEIRITEEPSQVSAIMPGAMCASSSQKRMSRSSEDVNKVTSITAGVKMFNTAFINKVPVTFKNKLVPTQPHEGRSTSDQDIFSTLVNMKGSHSESAIKDGNPVPKRDVVFAPLGKLARGMQTIGANYFDPRKLRDSLRQPRQEIVPPEDPEVLEMMKTCKTTIIDV